MISVSVPSLALERRRGDAAGDRGQPASAPRPNSTAASRSAPRRSPTPISIYGSPAARQSRQLVVGHRCTTRFPGRTSCSRFTALRRGRVRRHGRGFHRLHSSRRPRAASAPASAPRLSPAREFSHEERIVRPDGEHPPSAERRRGGPRRKRRRGAHARRLPRRDRAQAGGKRAARIRAELSLAAARARAITRSTCSTPRAMCAAGTTAPSASRATRPRKLSAAISASSCRQEARAGGMAGDSAGHRRARRPVRGRDLAGAQGRQPLLCQHRDGRDPQRRRRADRLCQADARHHRASTRRKLALERRASRWRRRRRWKRSAS